MTNRFTIVHPICTHYTKGLFEELARRDEMQFLFFSEGGEWFWQKEHGIHHGEFPHEYLAGFRIGRLRITPSLPWKLLRAQSDAILSSIDGKFALPVSYMVARSKGVPFLLWTGIWSRGNTLFDKLMGPITRFFYRHADAVIVYGDHVKCYLVTEGVDPDRVFVARHSMDNEYYSRQVTEAEKFALRERLGVPSDKKVILFLGRLEEVKGVRYLIEAFASQSSADAVLLVAGEGSQRPVLESLAKALCPPRRVFFPGYIRTEDAVLFYSIAYVCVIPSITMPTGKELWGLVANEAFNQGVPVIATASVGAAAGGFVRDAENGFVVPERDSPSLSAAIGRVLGNPELRKNLSVGARATIAGWTHARMADGFTDAFDFALRRRSQYDLYAKARQSVAGSGCPLCGNERSFTRTNGAFRRCKGCGLMFRYPRPELQDLHALYGQSWVAPMECCAETGGTTRILAEEYAKRLGRALGRQELKGLKILDYGAGRGEFARVLSRLGADVYAVDPYGKPYLEQMGLRAYATLDELPADLRFDGIVSIDVVEHELAAWDVLRRFRDILAPGGWVYVATPNPNGLNAKVFGSHWREAKKPGHLVFFGPKTLERVLQEAGFARTQRLRWNIRYGKSLLTRAKDFVLSQLELDGELRYLAFHREEKRA